MEIIPWRYHTKAHRPKTLEHALKWLLASDMFTLDERSLAIAAGVNRSSVYDWKEGRSLPTEPELHGLCGAFVLNKFGRILATPRNQLLKELKKIIEAEKK